MSVENGCPPVLALRSETALSRILQNYGDVDGESEKSLSKSEDLSVQKILFEDSVDEGSNPLPLNPATEFQKFPSVATCGASSAPSDTPAPSLVVNLLNANRDVQENSSDDHSPSSGSISPQGEETSSGDEGGWQEAPSSAKKKKRVLNRSGEADGDERRGALGAPLSLALGNPVIPLGLMRIKRVVPPKAHTVIELGSGSKF